MHTTPNSSAITTISVHELPQERQAQVIAQCFDILLAENNYPSFGSSEFRELWLASLFPVENGKAVAAPGTRMAICAALDATGKVVGFTALQRFDDNHQDIGLIPQAARVPGGASLPYTCVSKDVTGYAHLEVASKTKAGMQKIVRDLQAAGIAFSIVSQEHMDKTSKPGHILKIMEGLKIGQRLMPKDTLYYFIHQYPGDTGRYYVRQLLLDVEPKDASVKLKDALRSFYVAYMNNNNRYSKYLPAQVVEVFKTGEGNCNNEGIEKSADYTDMMAELDKISDGLTLGDFMKFLKANFDNDMAEMQKALRAAMDHSVASLSKDEKAAIEAAIAANKPTSSGGFLSRLFGKKPAAPVLGHDELLRLIATSLDDMTFDLYHRREDSLLQFAPLVAKLRAARAAA